MSAHSYNLSKLNLKVTPDALKLFLRLDQITIFNFLLETPTVDRLPIVRKERHEPSLYFGSKNYIAEPGVRLRIRAQRHTRVPNRIY